MKRWSPAFALCLMLAASTEPCAAQERSTLAAAEQAYAEVDFERARALARRAIEQGGNDSRRAARLYLLWATSAAALDSADESRQAYTHLLAISPGIKLDHSLSPKVRTPYLEARGALGGNGEPTTAPLSAKLELVGERLVLNLSDVLHVAARVELHARVQSKTRFEPRSFPAQESYELAGWSAPLDYYLRVVDRHGNALLEEGSAARPIRISPPPRLGPSAAPDVEAGRSATPYYLTAGALAVLGAASGAGAALFYLEREQAAKEWNGSACERPGSSRREQCAAVDDRRAQSERLTIALGATSGALLLGSALSLLLAPSSPTRRVSFGANPGEVAVFYGGTL